MCFHCSNYTKRPCQSSQQYLIPELWGLFVNVVGKCIWQSGSGKRRLLTFLKLLRTMMKQETTGAFNASSMSRYPALLMTLFCISLVIFCACHCLFLHTQLWMSIHTGGLTIHSFTLCHIFNIIRKGQRKGSGFFPLFLAC